MDIRKCMYRGQKGFTAPTRQVSVFSIVLSFNITLKKKYVSRMQLGLCVVLTPDEAEGGEQESETSLGCLARPIRVTPKQINTNK